MLVIEECTRACGPRLLVDPLGLHHAIASVPESMGPPVQESCHIEQYCELLDLRGNSAYFIIIIITIVVIVITISIILLIIITVEIERKLRKTIKTGTGKRLRRKENHEIPGNSNNNNDHLAIKTSLSTKYNVEC